MVNAAKRTIDAYADINGETDYARAAGRAKMSEADVEWKVPDVWWEAARAIEDPVEREAALQRLSEIQGYMETVANYLDGMDPATREIFMSRALAAGGTLETGSMGEVFSLIFSGNTALLPQLMGDDRAAGLGDGLDIDEWSETQTKFFTVLQELRNAMDIKPMSAAQKLFDAWRNGMLQSYIDSQPRDEDEEEEVAAS